MQIVDSKSLLQNYTFPLDDVVKFSIYDAHQHNPKVNIYKKKYKHYILINTIADFTYSVN